ncbi:hypothetical protein [Chitinibacter sp. S2-10]|uniref:hypothetical protein n=1 Tax=Chitinibacter sp. S2-10 TaxID=3373597 RepID=UPI003977C109
MNLIATSKKYLDAVVVEGAIIVNFGGNKIPFGGFFEWLNPLFAMVFNDCGK